MAEPKGRSRLLTRCWIHSRYCCCRYGLYPLALAPILTAASLLSLYSTSGCKYVDVDIGFTPVPNAAWNTSTAALGFWYQSTDFAYENDIVQALHGGCELYTNAFDDIYIDQDRTWRVARIMALISGAGSISAALLSWSFVFTSCPTRIFWPGLLLPLVIVAFIAEGSKFLIFDMGICRANIFFPAGENSLPLAAASCSLGESAILGVTAGSLLLVGLLMVCLHAPRERELDPHFGAADPVHNNRMYQEQAPNNRDLSVYSDDDDLFEMEMERYAAHKHQGGGSVSSSSQGPLHGESLLPSLHSPSHTQMDSSSIPHSRHGPSSLKPPSHNILNDMKKGKQSLDNNVRRMSPDPELDDIEIQISESRLSTLASVEEKAAGSAQSTTTTSLLERLVRDLNCTYQSSQPPRSPETRRKQTRNYI